MLYVLGAMLVVSFMAIALLKMSDSDKIENVLYRTSESAKSAAKSGIIAATSFLSLSNKSSSEYTIDSVFVINMLNSWYKSISTSSIDSKYQYLPPVYKTGATSPNSFVTMSPNQQYKVKILGVDFNDVANGNITISLRCNSIGKGNSKSEIISVYKLKGFKLDYNKGTLPVNALHLGGGADEINRALEVHGGAYMKGGGYCYDPTFDSTEFFGKVYVEKGNNPFLFKGTVFHNNAYFNGDVKIKQNFVLGSYSTEHYGGKTYFRKYLGFDGQLWYNDGHTEGTTDHNANFESLITIDSGVYSNGSIYGESSYKIILNSNGKGTNWEGPNRFYKRKNSSAQIKEYPFDSLFTNGTFSNSSDSINIVAKLGVIKPPAVPFNYDLIKAYEQTSGINTISGEDLNTLFSNAQAAGTTFKDNEGNDWLILHYQGETFSSSGTGFTGRVIWVVDDTSQAMSVNSSFYEHDVTIKTVNNTESRTSGGITVIYVTNGSRIVGLGGASAFRGFVYSDTKCINPNIYKAIEGTTFYGGIYQKDDCGKFRIEGSTTGAGSKFKIYYDPNVINEIAALGIFTDTSDVNDKEIYLQANRISMDLLSQAM